jgi:hypothetical protein
VKKRIKKRGKEGKGRKQKILLIFVFNEADQSND